MRNEKQFCGIKDLGIRMLRVKASNKRTIGIIQLIYTRKR